MIEKKITLIILLFIGLKSTCFSQQKALVSIQFPEKLITQKTEIFFYNGISRKKILFNQGEKKLIISDSFYSPFAMLTIHIDSNNCGVPIYNTFFVSNKPSVVSLTCDGNNISVNAYNLDSLSIMYSNYIKPEENEFEKWNNSLTGKLLDSLAFEKNKFLIRQLVDKKLDFIKLHDTNKYESYFSFEKFKNEIAPNAFADPNTLLSFYEENFSDTLKSSYEGKLIRNMITARYIANAKGVQNIKAPAFSTTDIFGKTISLKDDLGKRIVLINFWASWCGPCLAELPAIKKIETEFPSSRLRIISVSYDIDTLKFNNARAKYKMDWTNIYQDRNLRNKFGANNSLPELFLIDTKGNIIYNRSKDETDFTKLKQLNYILKKQIK